MTRGEHIVNNKETINKQFEEGKIKLDEFRYTDLTKDAPSAMPYKEACSYYTDKLNKYWNKKYKGTTIATEKAVQDIVKTDRCESKPVEQKSYIDNIGNVFVAVGKAYVDDMAVYVLEGKDYKFVIDEKAIKANFKETTCAMCIYHRSVIGTNINICLKDSTTEANRLLDAKKICDKFIIRQQDE